MTEHTHLHEMSKRVKSIDIESRKRLKAWEVTTNGYGASSRGDESVLKLDCNKGCTELT